MNMTQLPIYTDHDELSVEEFNILREKCLKARDVSYSPYSKFRVGCALLTESGEYFMGANIENASSGACICAERTTLCLAIANGCKKFKAIAISSDCDEIISPCGICRQFIREFGPLTLPIFMLTKTGDFKKMYLQDLLPISFGPEYLGITN